MAAFPLALLRCCFVRPSAESEANSRKGERARLMVRRGRVVASVLGVCILVRVRTVSSSTPLPAGCQCPSVVCHDENPPSDRQKSIAVLEGLEVRQGRIRLNVVRQFHDKKKEHVLPSHAPRSCVMEKTECCFFGVLNDVPSRSFSHDKN